MMTLFRPYFVTMATLFGGTFWRLKSNFRMSFEKLEMCCKVIFSLSRALFLYFCGNRFLCDRSFFNFDIYMMRDLWIKI